MPSLCGRLRVPTCGRQAAQDERWLVGRAACLLAWLPLGSSVRPTSYSFSVLRDPSTLVYHLYRYPSEGQPPWTPPATTHVAVSTGRTRYAAEPNLINLYDDPSRAWKLTLSLCVWTQAIRKKVELELQRKGGKRSAPDGSSTKRRGGGRTRPRGPAAQPGTVAALRPVPALTVPQHISVADASQLCAAKRTDCVLVVDDYQRLAGIFTAKDLAFRVRSPRSYPPLSCCMRSCLWANWCFLSSSSCPSPSFPPW